MSYDKFRDGLWKLSASNDASYFAGIAEQIGLDDTDMTVDFFLRIVFHYADGKDFLQESIESEC